MMIMCKETNMIFTPFADKVLHPLAGVAAIHNHDVIMTTMASQITSLTVVYSTVYWDADQRKHQSYASLAFVWGIHRDRWIPHTKGQLRGKCFHLMTSSCWHRLRLGFHASANPEIFGLNKRTGFWNRLRSCYQLACETSTSKTNIRVIISFINATWEEMTQRITFAQPFSKI